MMNVLTHVEDFKIMWCNSDVEDVKKKSAFLDRKKYRTDQGWLKLNFFFYGLMQETDGATYSQQEEPDCTSWEEFRQPGGREGKNDQKDQGKTQIFFFFFIFFILVIFYSCYQ